MSSMKQIMEQDWFFIDEPKITKPPDFCPSRVHVEDMRIQLEKLSKFHHNLWRRGKFPSYEKEAIVEAITYGLSSAKNDHTLPKLSSTAMASLKSKLVDAMVSKAGWKFAKRIAHRDLEMIRLQLDVLAQKLPQDRPPAGKMALPRMNALPFVKHAPSTVNISIQNKSSTRIGPPPPEGQEKRLLPSASSNSSTSDSDDDPESSLSLSDKIAILDKSYETRQLAHSMSHEKHRPELRATYEGSEDAEKRLASKETLQTVRAPAPTQHLSHFEPHLLQCLSQCKNSSLGVLSSASSRHCAASLPRQ